MKELSVEDQIYLCKYHNVDKGLSYTLGIRENEVEFYVKKYKDNGLYEKYRNLTEEEYENIINKRIEPPKSKIEQILSKYNFDKDNVGYKYLVELLEFLNGNKTTSINDGCYEIAKRYDKELKAVQNSIYRVTSEQRISLSELLKDKLNWKGAPKKGWGAKKNEQIQDEKIIEKPSNNIPEIPMHNTEFNIEGIIVKVPIKVLLELNYYKGYVDRLREER